MQYGDASGVCTNLIDWTKSKVLISESRIGVSRLGSTQADHESQLFYVETSKTYQFSLVLIFENK